MNYRKIMTGIIIILIIVVIAIFLYIQELKKQQEDLQKEVDELYELEKRDNIQAFFEFLKQEENTVKTGNKKGVV
ncbi:MAG: hypothetical protein WCY37_03835 [Candidatus Dojkabacteria bacterium]